MPARTSSLLLKPLRIGAYVTLKGSDTRGVVIAQERERLKILWPTYTSTWNSPSELLAVKKRRRQTREHK